MVVSVLTVNAKEKEKTQGMERNMSKQNGQIRSGKQRLALVISAMALAVIVLGASGCAAVSNFFNNVKGDLIGNSYTISAYDNEGNRTLEMSGDKVSLSGNKVSSSSSSDGETISTLSSVVTVTIDGKEVESCGDTLIFEGDGLTPVVDFATERLQNIESSTDGGISENTLLARPLNAWETAFGKKRVCVIKSQDGTFLTAYAGDEITWDIPDDLPKTTKLLIDGKPLYIHRANFQIIDAELLR